MSKTQTTKTSQSSPKKCYWLIGIAFLCVFIITTVYLTSKKTQNPNEEAHTPMFRKQGTLTFIKKPSLPIITIDIEIADDENKREIGLMGRPTMEEQQGMLFVFDHAQIQSFWMHNTILSLDMIYIDANGVIKTIHKNTTPFSDQTYQSTEPVLYVLEVLSGFTDKYNIVVGDKTEWKRE